MTGVKISEQLIRSPRHQHSLSMWADSGEVLEGKQDKVDFQSNRKRLGNARASWSWNQMKTSQELRMLSSVTINCQVRMIVWIQVLNCQNCNQCLKCQVSSTVFPIVRVKNEGKKWNKIVINRGLLHMPSLLSKKQMLLHNECMEIFIDRDPDNEMGTQWGPKATKIGTKTELL